MSGSSTRQTMYDKFQPWVLATYGDSAKTKTITTKKAKRIVKLLQAKEKDGAPGPEPAGSEGAKFRLWVKSKGLTLSRGPGVEAGTLGTEAGETEDTSLYLPTGTEQSLDGKVQFVFKKVAVVEKFFDIIYSVHVESESGEAPHLRGRAGKHCGQKRTYRAIADQYAFIPREAISRFLTFCSECQRKQPPHTGPRKGGGVTTGTTEQQLDAARDGPLFYKPPLVTPPATPPSLTEASGGPGAGEENNALAASLRRALQQQQQDPARCGGHSGLGSGVSSVSRGSLGSGSGLLMAAPPCHQGTPEPAGASSGNTGVTILPVTAENLAKLDNSRDIDLSFPITSTYLRQMRHRPMELTSAAVGAEPDEDDDEDNDDLNIHDDGEDSPVTSQGAWPAFSSAPASASLKPGPGLQVSALGQLLGGQNGNIASMSPVRSDMSRDESIVDDTSSVGNKEDDEDDEEDGNDDEKFEGMSGDPERLKAFNMFVRLFVDENLDRHVPISKQPKEKIQAIIDSCTRQFPEFSVRSRKRIRTYLKSCRRTKRSREQAGLDINNRPTPPHLTSVLAEQLLARACENEAENAKRMRMGIEPVSQSLPSQIVTSQALDSVTGGAGGYKADQLVSLLAASHQAASAGSGHNGVSGHRAGGGGVSPFSGAGANTNGHTEAGAKRSPLLSHKLNGTEITAVRQLITGYRESAAFLLRSADELENLLSLQPKL